MELIRGIHNIRKEHHQCVLTIGNFDGVHLGHQSILKRVKCLAEKYQTTSCVMIFEPQPREFFLRQDAPKRISRFRDKLKLLEPYGIDYVLCLPFNTSFQQLDAEAFCQLVLKDRLAIKHLVVGDDFHFGCDRQGDFDYLRQFGAKHGFLVENTSSILSLLQERVSSSLVRQYLNDGKIQEAENLLGHPVVLSGRVVHGKKIGRTLGFPTVNVSLKNIVPALSGVFAVELMHGSKVYHAVANVGCRPTLEKGVSPILEVHIFDYSGSLYGEYVDVEFCYFIREERKMSGLDELQMQIQADKEDAQRFFHYQ